MKPVSAGDKVAVCASCLTEACWNGTLMCEAAKTAGVVIRRRGEMDAPGAVPARERLRLLAGSLRGYADRQDLGPDDLVRQAAVTLEEIAGPVPGSVYGIRPHIDQSPEELALKKAEGERLLRKGPRWIRSGEG